MSSSSRSIAAALLAALATTSIAATAHAHPAPDTETAPVVSAADHGLAYTAPRPPTAACVQPHRWWPGRPGLR